jgi:hypothetical protein
MAAAFPCRAELIDEPLQLSNQQPLAQLFNLPAMRAGEVLPADTTVWRGGLSVANNFVRAQNVEETLVIDGESQRYELSIRRSIGNRFEIGMSVPWISYNGGVLDGFIEGWHNVWGLPDGGRPDYAKRQLTINYQRRGRAELDFDRAEAGFGDAQLTAAWQLIQSAQNAVALAGHINLPTGDADKLTGSGKGSAGFTLAATHTRLFDLPLTLSGNIGAQWQPRGDVLGDQQKQSVWFASTEINWALAQDWRLKVQVQAHSALYTSELRALGSDAMQLLLGGSVNLSKNWLLDVAVGEDIAVDTAPDVTLQLALRARY